MEADNSSGLLINIVRSLSTSGHKDDRNYEKVALEREFKECDSRLDSLIAHRLTDLTSIIQTFSLISSRVTMSREKIRTVKENLQSCKNLLHCKQDELKRLWVEGIKFKTAAELMEEVEKIKGVNEQLKRALDGRDYVEVASLIMSSLSVLEGDLSTMKGLDEIKKGLYMRREEVVARILEELHAIIYVRSTSTILKTFQRQGSQARNRFDIKSNTSLEQASEADEEKLTKAIMEANIDTLTRTPLPSSPLSDPVIFISSLITSLATLRRLPEAIEHLKQHISPSISTIINTASQKVVESCASFEDDLQHLQQPQLLLDALQLIIAQTHIISKAHQIVIANLLRIKASTNQLTDFKLYAISDLWNKVQSLLETFLANHLEVDEHADHLHHSNSSISDFNSFFSKKKSIARGKKSGFLFKFNQSDQTVATTTDTQTGNIRQTLVCKPSADNITHVFNTINRLLCDIASITKNSRHNLPLHHFISTFVEHSFMLKLQHSMDAILNSAAKSHDPKKGLTDAHTQKSFKLQRPLFHSTIAVATFIDRLCQLTTHLPDYSSKLMNLLCKSLHDYHSHLQTLYKQISHTDDRSVISATWVRDSDINRFLKSLPNWMELKRVEETLISEADLRAMNAKESSVISSNLSGSGVQHTDLLTEHSTLKHFGHLCESCLWFSQRIDEFCGNLENGNSTLKFLLSTSIKPHLLSNQGDLDNATLTNHKLHVSTDVLMTLKSLARHFEELSDSCLLLLHLEVRMHCLHHLLRLPEGDYYCLIDRLEPDEHVTRLCKDLSQTEAALVPALQDNRLRYLFQGLGHLIATTLTTAAANISRINDTGVKKMCRNIATVQQCLTTFSDVREPDLDHARQFYELLYLSPDEVMKECYNAGSLFTEHEYTLLLSLNHRSNPELSTEADLNRRLKKLASILGDSSA